MIWLLIGYMFLFIHRPFEIWPELAALRIERVFMIITLVAAFLSGRIRPHINIITVATVGLVLAILASWMQSPWSGLADVQTTVIDWLKIIVFFVLTTFLCRDRRLLMMLIIGLVAATGLYVTHSVYEYHLGRHQFSMGVRRLLGINEALRHPNAFAAVSLITMPYAFFLMRRSESKWIWWSALVYMAISSYGVILTSSRMGIIGLACIALFVIIRHPYRIRLLLLIAIASVAVWYNLPENKQNRILSIFNSDYAPENAKVSADVRIESFWDGIELFKQHPLTGAGPGTWQVATEGGLVSHNLYGQVLGETGLVGAAAFLLLNLVCIRQSYLISRIYGFESLKDEDDRRFYNELGIVFVCVFIIMLLFGMAGGTLFRYFWIWNAALVVVAMGALENTIAESEDTELESEDDE